MSPDPKPASASFLDPQSWNRYVYARNNPLLYVDPDGRDFEKAWQEAKTFAKTFYVKLSVGVGAEVKVKAGAFEAKAGVVYKGSIETSKDSITTISRSVEAGASAGLTHGPKAGESVSTEQTIATVQNNKTITGQEKAHVETTDTIGGHTTATNSDDKLGIGVEAVGHLHRQWMLFDSHLELRC